jgi:hypothetical protein
MILIFTSAKAGRPYYMRDLLNVCCEPAGRIITFGYRNKWVATDLRSGADLDGKDALIIFSERDAGDPTRFRYHPIRMAKIIKPASECGSVTIPLQLAGLFDYQKYNGQLPVGMADFGQNTSSKDGQTAAPAKTQEFALVREDSKGRDKSDFSGEWLPLVEYMSRLEGLKSCTFFHEQVGGLPGSKIPPLNSTATSEPGKLQYTVEAGKSYQMTYKVFFGEGSAQKPMSIGINEKVASIGGPFVSQWSSGFEASFVLNFSRTFESGTSTLSVTVPPKTEDKIEAPEIHALLKVKVPRYVLPSAIFLMIAGSVLISLAEDPAFSQSLAFNLLLLVKGAGAFALGVGSWIGFQKLPFAGG